MRQSTYFLKKLIFVTSIFKILIACTGEKYSTITNATQATSSNLVQSASESSAQSNVAVPPPKKTDLITNNTSTTKIPTAQPSSQINPNTLQEPVTPAVINDNTPKIGMATHYEAIPSSDGSVGACGVPASDLDTQDYVALNFYNTPKFYGRNESLPVDGNKMGAYSNGKNCGRWIEVTIKRYCHGTNTGTNCSEGSWVNDSYTGATKNFLIADGCDDNSVWCRDDKNHVDIRTEALEGFTLNGKILKSPLKTPGNYGSDSWNNREISWKFINAPLNMANIKFGFGKDSDSGWKSIVVKGLSNGIHGMQFKTSTGFKDADMFYNCQGQSYLVPDGSIQPFEVKVKDASDKFIESGKSFVFNFPTQECSPKCNKTVTWVKHSLK